MEPSNIWPFFFGQTDLNIHDYQNIYQLIVAWDVCIQQKLQNYFYNRKMPPTRGCISPVAPPPRHQSCLICIRWPTFVEFNKFASFTRIETLIFHFAFSSYFNLNFCLWTLYSRLCPRCRTVTGVVMMGGRWNIWCVQIRVSNYLLTPHTCAGKWNTAAHREIQL